MALHKESINYSGNEDIFDAQTEIIKRTKLLTEYLGSTGIQGYLLEVSTDKRDLLAGMIARRAVNQHRMLGHEMKFHAFLPPINEPNETADYDLTLKVINADYEHFIDTTQIVKAFNREYSESEGSEPHQTVQQYTADVLTNICKQSIANDNNLATITTAESPVDTATKCINPLDGLTIGQCELLLRAIGAPYVLTYKDY